MNNEKYYADREITNTYEKLIIVWSQFFTDKLIFIYIWSNSNIYSIFGFIANKYKQRAIQLHLTICNIRSAIQWAITKVILNYSPIPIYFMSMFGYTTLLRVTFNLLMWLASWRLNSVSRQYLKPFGLQNRTVKNARANWPFYWVVLISSSIPYLHFQIRWSDWLVTHLASRVTFTKSVPQLFLQRHLL